jgi:ribosomal protein S13
MRKPRELTADDIDSLVEAYQRGASVYALAQRFGTRVQRVKRLLAWRGVRLRQSKRGPKSGGEQEVPWEATEEASREWLKEHGFR